MAACRAPEAGVQSCCVRQLPAAFIRLKGRLLSTAQQLRVLQWCLLSLCVWWLFALGYPQAAACSEMDCIWGVHLSFGLYFHKGWSVHIPGTRSPADSVSLS